MKNIIDITIKHVTTAIVFLTIVFLPACNENPDEYKITDGLPEVSFVRVPDALCADSLISHAFMNNTIAIVGKNLTSVKELWFNDKKAILNTSFITSSSLIVTIPNSIPDKVSNKMYLINQAGDTVKYDFKVDVPSPFLKELQCEYVSDGDTAVISGNYFLPVEGNSEPEVYFTPNLQAEVVSYSLTELKVKVPAGAKMGPVTVKSRYGSSRSNFKFRDNTNIISDFESSSYGNPWGLGAFSKDNGCSGQYLLFENSAFGPWSWLNNMMWVYSAVDGAGNKPIASGNLTKLALRFETNVGTWDDEQMIIWFTPFEASFSGVNVDANYAQYHWKPYLVNGVRSTYKTNGWITVTIPLSSFNTDKGESRTDLTIGNISQFSNINIMLFGGFTSDDTAKNHPIKICMDNLRIVSIQ